MNEIPEQAGECQVCHQHKSLADMLPANMVRSGMLRLVKEKVPHWDPKGYICFSCLNRIRSEYIEDLLEKDLGELDELEKEVVESLRENELLSENLNEEYEKHLTLGDRIADKVAEFGGSWTFIGWFALFILVWIGINTWVLIWRPFDPYPFILLNLLLSLLAAIQAPIIMMSQNRQEDRDRMRAENDYQVNLKSEVEVRIISEKLDQLLHHEMRRFLEIQQIQTDMLNELQERLQKTR
ncbi:MAG TPA: DUF1003 domain-containing protein [Gammaproteobacteria bacterium]|nr:DUF1003 domain-containing protein [Gammaproteobacteria bacterium]